MNLRETTRWFLALFGSLFFFASSLMPVFGGHAKWIVRCRGREFTGDFDDCFNDHLPFFEMAAPLVALVLLYAFGRFAFTLFAPVEEGRTREWRLAISDGGACFPSIHLMAALGALWAGSRAAFYPLDPVTFPYIAFWGAFSLWFVVGISAAWPNERTSD